MGTSGPIHVLHVDDEPDFADLAAEFLEREDDRFAVETATSASEGLDRLDEHDYDCIVSDFDMPGMDGIEFLGIIREEYPGLPFILFTGKGSEEVASEAITAGASDYLQKGSGGERYELLANRITNTVAQSRATRTIERTQERHQRHRETLIELLMDEAVKSGDFETAVHRITETAADVLNVPRVNIWLVEDDDGETMLTCIDHYERETGDHTGGMTLAPQEYPAYFEALETHRAIDATDASDDPRTSELTDDYLAGHDIGALLDATLRSAGETIGVVCHEHVGGPREWTDDEIDFASDIADVVHRALRNQDHKERELKPDRERDRRAWLFENLHAATAYFEFEDGEPVITEINPVFEETFGISQEAATGQVVDDVIVPEDAVDEAAAINERVLAGGPVDTEVVRQTDNGPRTFTLRLVPLDQGTGGERGFAIYSDITERRERKQELEINDLTRTIYQAVIGASTEHEIFDIVCKTAANSDMFTLAWIGKHSLRDDEVEVVTSEGTAETYLDDITITVHGDDPKGEGPTGRAFRTKRIQIARNIPDNSSFGPWREAALARGFNASAAVPISHQNDFFGVLNLYTERANAFDAEETIALSELGTVIGFGIKYVNMHEQLEVLNRILRHDIRNYTNVIIGRGELLQEDLSSEAEEHLKKLLTVAGKIVDLTDQSRALARATSEASSSLERVDLIETVRNEVRNIRQVYDECEVGVRIADDADTIHVAANQMLSSVIRNLLENAVTHNDKEQPRVDVDIATDESSTVTLTIADNGPGIPEKRRDEILEKGVKGAGSSGTGIGLYLAQTLVDQYGGDVWIEDNDPEGTVFTILLQKHLEAEPW